MKNRNIGLRRIFLLPVIPLFLLIGCERETAEERLKAEDLREARGELFREVYTTGDSKRKEKLIALKYDIPPKDVDIILADFRRQNPVMIHMESMELDTADEVRELTRRLRNPEIREHVTELSQVTGVSPQTIVSMIIDYESWISVEDPYR